MAYFDYSVDPAIADPRWADAEKTIVDLNVFFPHLKETVRYTAAATDTGWEHSEELYNNAVNGLYGVIAAYVAPVVEAEADWRGFLQALRGTTVFASLRGQARVDVAANALATELRTALGEAALGLVEADVIQALMDELLPALAPEQIAEIGAGISAFNVPLSLAAP